LSSVEKAKPSVAAASGEERRRPTWALESEVASFRLLMSQGLINNGRDMVRYRGPFQCLAAGCETLVGNNKLVVRHWNEIHK
jgi:hypothetical protein